ncbi:MAG: O-antigen ligase family protein [Weeksellaceae bacterium]
MLKKIKTAYNRLTIDSLIRTVYYFLFFFMPLVMSARTSEIFEFNKMMLLYVGTLLIAILALIRFTVYRDVRKHVYLLPLLGFLGTIFLSTSTSVDPHTSIFGHYGRFNGGLISIIAYVVLSITALQIFDKKSINTLLKVSLVSSFIVILWGIPGKLGVDLSCILFTGQYTNACWTADFQPAVRMFSTLGQPNWLGSYLAIHFFIALYFVSPYFLTLINKEVLMSKQKIAFIILTVYGLCNLMGIWFTQSRSSLLALAIALVICAALAISKYKARFFQPLYLTLMLSIVIGIAALIFFPKQLLSTSVRPQEGFFVTDSSEIRKIVWQGSVALGMRYPLLGTGPETFAYTYFLTRPLEHNYVSEWDFIYNKAHNEFLHYFATTGFLGLMMYLVVIIGTLAVIFMQLKKTSIERLDFWFYLSLLGAYLTILITNFFGFSTSTIQLYFYLIPILAITYSLKVHIVETVQFTQLSRQLKMFYGILVFLLIVGLYMITRMYKADMLYAEAKVLIAQDDHQQASVKLVQALANHYEHVYEDKLSGTLAQLAFISSFDDPQTTSELTLMSQQYNLHTISESPYNQQYYRTQAKNYYLYYQSSRNIDDLLQAVKATEAAIKIAPTDPQNYHTLALFYTVLSQESTVKADQAAYAEQARESVRNALRLKPYYVEAQELLKSL